MPTDLCFAPTEAPPRQNLSVVPAPRPATTTSPTTSPTTPPVTSPTEAGAELVEAAVRGDRDAVEGVLRWVRPLIVRYCRARFGGAERTFASADDVAQEVCLAVLAALPGYRDQGRPFLAFVYGIAAHKVADAHRSAARNRSEPVADVPDAPTMADGPEQRAMQSELVGQMNTLLGALPPKQREILVLRVVAGLSADETAAAVGLTSGAVRVAQHRALSRLRGMLTRTAGTALHGLELALT